MVSADFWRKRSTREKVAAAKDLDEKERPRLFVLAGLTQPSTLGCHSMPRSPQPRRGEGRFTPRQDGIFYFLSLLYAGYMPD